jgi:hydrogenase maturation protease
MAKNIRVIGIGNEYRRDDGAGLVAARRLRDLRLPGVTVLERNGGTGELWELWQDPGPAILIDTMRSGSPPGTVRRFDAAREPVPAAPFHTPSTHSLGVSESLELARTLGQLPAFLIVYGIEGKVFAPGLGLSPEVAEALPRLVARIRRDLVSRRA